MQIAPPRYGWTATTVHDALAYLEAAANLLHGHLDTLHPDSIGKGDARREAPISLRVELDLGPLVHAINLQDAATP